MEPAPRQPISAWHAVRVGAVAVVWLMLFGATLMERIEERQHRAKTRQDLVSIDLTLRTMAAVKAVGPEAPALSQFGKLGNLLDDDSFDVAASPESALRGALATIIEDDEPSDETMAEAETLLRQAAEDHDAADLETIAKAMQPEIDDESVALALSTLDQWDPPWLGQAVAWRIASHAGMTTEAEGYRTRLRTRSLLFLGAITSLVLLMLAAALVGIFLLPIHVGLRICGHHQQQEEALQADDLPVFSDVEEPDNAPRWSILVGVECVTLIFVGQAAFGWLIANIAPAELEQHSPLVALVISLGGGLLAVLYSLWRMKQAGSGQREAMGLAPMPWWRALGWGVAAYCCALPVIYAAGYIVSKLAGEAYSVNPALEMGEKMSSPIEFAAMFLMIVVSAPFIEEIVFRGALYGPIRARVGATTAILVTGFGFAAIHLDPLVGPQLAVIGIALAYVRERSGSLYPGMVLHALQNGFALGLICVMKL